MNQKSLDEQKAMFGLLNKNKVLQLKIIKILVVILCIFITIFAILRFSPYKDYEQFIKRQNSSRFYDKNNKLIYVLPLTDGIYREYYSLEEIPTELQKIFIFAEDQNFYKHPGFNIASIFRAAKQNIQENKTVSGASTITMQLARIISPRKPGKKITITTKLKEVFNAIRIECRISKKKILELYLNSLPFGNQIEGIGSASRFFYNKNLNELNTSQMLMLSVVPRRPSFYSPINDPKKSYERAMEIGRKINFEISLNKWIEYTTISSNKYEQKQNHYVNWIFKQYTIKKQKVPNKIELKIDTKLNNLIECEIQQQLEIYSESRIQNGAALVIENQTGNIIAWVGNSNFDNPNSGQVDGVFSKHQSGSSTKPFLYALALQEGIKPTNIFADIPKDFGGEKVYVPLNFNNRYNGPQRMRVALASSLNIPAVELLYNLSIDSYMNFLIQCGFESLKGTREYTGLSLALGSNEVSLYELVQGFSIFPNDGILRPIQINDNFSKKHDKQVIETDTARIICDFLSDKAAQSLGFGNAKVFNTEYPSIFKTGTANQYQDIIALGATKEYTVGVWLGNLNGETVIKKTGSSIPALIARNILDYLTLPQLEQLDKKGSLKFDQPEHYTKTQICTLSGCKPNQNCPSVSLEYVKNQQLKKFTTRECSWHIIKNNQLSINYPSEYQHWVSGKNMSGFSTNQIYTPIDFSYPTDGATFVFDKSIPQQVQVIRIQAYGGKTNQAELFYDGKSQGTATNRFVWQIPLETGTHQLEIICHDESDKILFHVY